MAQKSDMKHLLRRILGWAFTLLVLACSGIYVFAPRDVAKLSIMIERTQAGLTPHSAEIPGFHIAYLEGGKGQQDEPLLLVHGSGAEKDNWTRSAKTLTRRYHVIAVDLPGYGESSRPPDAHYRIEDQVERLHYFVHGLGYPAIHLGGNSMGAWIAGSYAVHYPDEVRSLWLLDAAGVSAANPSEMGERIAKGERIPIFARTIPEFDQVMDFVFTHPPFIPSPVKRIYAERASANYSLNVKIFNEVRSQSLPLDKTVAGLKTPTLIVWGSDDRVQNVSGAEILHRLMPDSKVVIMSGVGHLPMLEAPRQAAEDYIAFRDSQAAAPLSAPR
nr:lipase 1 [uncultured bacterium]